MRGDGGREINREIGQETTVLSSKMEFGDKLRVEGLYKEKMPRYRPGVSFFLLGSRHLLAYAICYSAEKGWDEGDAKIRYLCGSSVNGKEFSSFPSSSAIAQKTSESEEQHHKLQQHKIMFRVGEANHTY